MANYSVDAIKIAKAIQKGELLILRGKEFKMRDRIKKKRRMKKTRKKKNKYTLNQLGLRIEQIGDALSKLNRKIDGVNFRIDNLENKVDGISTRLDYIVQANNLKDNK